MKAQMTWLCLIHITEAQIPLNATKVVPATGSGKDYANLDRFEGFSNSEANIQIKQEFQ